MTRVTICLIFMAWLVSTGVAEVPPSEAAKWEKKYQQLLRDRPDIRNKVDSGGATKQDVITWMKKGGDRQKSQGGKKYYGAEIQVKDPAEFSQGQERIVYSGPQPGERLPTFKVTGLRGKYKGKEIDPLALANGKPLVLIFQDNSVVGQKGLALCGKILAQIADHSPKGLHVWTTFLVDDPTLNNIFRYDFLHEIDNVIEMGVSLDRREGPEAYGLNRNIPMTIIVAKDGKVLHNFPLKQPMLYPNPYVIGGIAEAIGVDRPTLAGWFQERQTNTIEQQESEKKRALQNKDQVKTAGANERDRTRGQDRRKRQYRNRRTLEVKDPSGFVKTPEKKIFSGPQPGEKLPAVAAIGVRGNLKDRQFDPVTDAKDNPHILIFQDDSGMGLRGLVGLARVVAQIAERSGNQLRYTTIFLGDDPAKLSQQAMKIDRYVPDFVQLGVSKDGRDGPGAYGLNRNVAMTILIAEDGKVTHNFTFLQGMLYPDPHVLGAVAAVLGEKRETVASWLNEAAAQEAAMRRDNPATTRDSDLAKRQMALQRRLGRLVEAGKITREEAAELYRTAFGDPQQSPGKRQ